MKGKKDVNRLVPVKRMITRGGQTFETTVYVRQHEVGRTMLSSNNIQVMESLFKMIDSPEQLENAMKYINRLRDPASKEVHRNELVDYIERAGVKWEKHEDKAINYMRCVMSARRALKAGTFNSDESQVPYKQLTTAQARDVLNKIKQAYSKEQIINFAKEDPNISWKESGNPNVDHMRMMIAIRESLEDGNGFAPVNETGALKRPMSQKKLKQVNALKDITSKVVQESHIHADINEQDASLTFNLDKFTYTIKVEYDKDGDFSVTTYDLNGNKLRTSGYGADELSRLVLNLNNKIALGKQILDPIYEREITKEDRDKLQARKSIHTREWGVQSDDCDSKAVYERSLETGETLWVAKEYDDVRFPKLETFGFEPERNDFDSDEAFQKTHAEWEVKKNAYMEQMKPYIEKMVHAEPQYTDEEIRAWANKHGIIIYADVMEFMDKAMWNDIIPVFEEMFEMFPKLKTYRSGRYREDKTLEIGFKDSQLYYDTYYCGSEKGIEICGLAFDRERCLNQLAYDIGTGLSVYGDGTLKAVIRHEFAHVLEFNSTYKEWGVNKEMNWETIKNEMVDGNVNKSHFDNIVRPLLDSPLNGRSVYAKTNIHEAFAEAFCEYTSTFGKMKSDKSEFANEVEKILVDMGLFDLKRLRSDL